MPEPSVTLPSERVPHLAQPPRNTRSLPPDRPHQFDFRPGGPDVSLFPRASWIASARRALQAAPDVRLDYGDPRGAPELRRALSEHLARTRGVKCDPERVVITSGVVQGTALFCRALIAQGGQRIAIEDPASAPGRDQVAATGLEVVSVPVDSEGLRIDRLEAESPDATVVTPAHQFPTGVVLAPVRRAALCDWAARAGAFVFEDDYDAVYRYDREPESAVQGLAPEHVVHAGSVSKALAPALRVGWLVVPERMVEAVAAAKADDDLGTPMLDQLALADFIERGELDRHVRCTRSVYRARREALREALARHLPGTRDGGVAAGLHAAVTVPAGVDEPALLAAARDRGIGLSGLSEHRESPGPPGLVLGYGRIRKAAIAPGIHELGSLANADPRG